MSNAITDEDIVTISKALADRTRLGILRTIASRGCVCCGDVARAFDVTQATVSHHLKVLTTAGFLERSKRGTWAYYKLIPGALDRISQLLVGS